MQSPSALAIKKIEKTGNSYIDDCFSLPFEELQENRKPTDVDGALGIPEAANTNKTDQALRLAEELQEKHPDYFWPYYWGAVLRTMTYSQVPRYDEARKILDEGLARARSKGLLCQERGDIEWETKNLIEAVKWWIRSVIIQISTNPQGHSSFLYLHYTAKTLGLGTASQKLRFWVDKIQPGAIELKPEELNELHIALSHGRNESMKQAIELLVAEYLG